jgi:hypothetical protein
MGYNDSGDFDMPDSFNDRKLKTLVPRPLPSTNNTSTASGHPCPGSRLHSTDFLALNQYHLGLGMHLSFLLSLSLIRCDQFLVESVLRYWEMFVLHFCFCSKYG